MTLSIHGIAASRALRPLWAATELGLNFKHVPTPYLDALFGLARLQARTLGLYPDEVPA